MVVKADEFLSNYRELYNKRFSNELDIGKQCFNEASSLLTEISNEMGSRVFSDDLVKAGVEVTIYREKMIKLFYESDWAQALEDDANSKKDPVFKSVKTSFIFF